MSLIDVSFVQAVADCIGVKPTEDAAKILAPDVEYRIKEIIQEAAKFARHSKRTHITPDDVNNAFRLKNVEPIYGLSNSSDPARFLKLAGHAECYYIHDPILPTQSIIDAPLPPLPWEADLRIHWLAIDGTQPAIPANTPVLPESSYHKDKSITGSKKQRQTDKHPAIIPSTLLDTNKITTANTETQQLPSQQQQQPTTTTTTPVAATDIDTNNNNNNQQQHQLVRLPFRHLVSRELQLYFDKITSILKSTSPSSSMQSKEYRAALSSLYIDAGLSPLSPYLCRFFADELISNIDNAPRLIIMLRGVACIAANEHLDLGANLHVLIPAVLTCLLGRESGMVSRKESTNVDNTSHEQHWAMRDHAGRAVAALCSRYPEVAPRMERKLVEGLRLIPGSGASLQSVYGAAVALHAQGPRAVRTFLLPNLIPVMAAMQDDLDGKKKGQERMEAALKARGALLAAAGQCIYASTACIAWSGPATVADDNKNAAGGGGDERKEESKKRKLMSKGPQLLALSPEQAEDITNKKVGKASTTTKGGKSTRGGRGGRGGRGRKGGATTPTKTNTAADVVTTTKLDDQGSIQIDGDDTDDDTTTLAQQAQQAQKSLQSLPSDVVFHPANQGHENGGESGGDLTKKRKNMDMGDDDGNYLVDAWKDDFPVEKMKKAMVELFGKDVEPYERLLSE